MSAVIPIKAADDPPPAADPADADGWALLDGMRRKLDDQAMQNRKTAAQVTQLAESIAALVEIQRRRTRRLNLNSFVAYVIFTLLCGGGAFAMYWSRSNELVAARDRAASDRDAAVRRADDATKTLAARDAADATAGEAWDLLAKGDRKGGAARIAQLAAAPLPRVERLALETRAADAQLEGGEAALKTAAAAFKAGRFGDVAAPLEAALASEPTGPRAPMMHYYLGVVAAKAGELDKAVAQLDAALAGGVSDDDARFQLASALDRKGEFAKARGEYDRFSTAHPQSPFAAYAMRRSATLARMPVVAPPALVVPTKPPMPAPTPVVPTPTPVTPTPTPVVPAVPAPDAPAAP